jgi:hypothetical protein
MIVCGDREMIGQHFAPHLARCLLTSTQYTQYMEFHQSMVITEPEALVTAPMHVSPVRYGHIPACTIVVDAHSSVHFSVVQTQALNPRSPCPPGLDSNCVYLSRPLLSLSRQMSSSGFAARKRATASATKRASAVPVGEMLAEWNTSDQGDS